ncbi:MAG: hypothetical protein IJX78_01790 [Bacilli bacterium]|nr:hypothetical protein [Bacilli bacterium]
MKNSRKVLIFLLLIFIFVLSGCFVDNGYIDITNGDYQIINVGEVIQLDIDKSEDLTGDIKWLIEGDSVTISVDGMVTGIKEGISTITVNLDGETDMITFEVKASEEIDITLITPSNNLEIGSSLSVEAILSNEEFLDEVSYYIVSGTEYASLEGDVLTGISEGKVVIESKVFGTTSNQVTIFVEAILTDPYEGMSKEEFYANYTEATSYMDAYYRSLHGFMSGSIAEQDQEPTLAEERPMEDGKYLKNSNCYYSEDGNTYLVVDETGKVVDMVFKGGGYVTLEDVAAYVFAFGDVPANYNPSKKAKPTSSIWKEYLRVNNTQFSGSTSKYPYEPELPNISGCGGDLKYYEIDLGTTGTDCDPKYPAIPYNNGQSIERGAARIVYSRYDQNGNQIIDINEKYVFYTYNHYNDFQEYLNYVGGWGEMFGNVTGGGTLSSKKDYNPTPYVDIILKDFTKDLKINKNNLSIPVVYKKEEELALF